MNQLFTDSGKFLLGTLTGALGLLAPVRELLLTAMVFVAVDFLTGVWASRSRTMKNGERWAFESKKARKTVYKLLFIMAGIIMAWLIDTYVLDILELGLSKMFTGFVCGVEMWSYLENAAEISDHPVFRWLKKFMRSKLEQGLASRNDDTL